MNKMKTIEYAKKVVAKLTSKNYSLTLNQFTDSF